MELLERYLQAIGRYLPAESRNDILAELRSELLDQMDARAAEWGRPLDEADVAALLKVHGRPEAIALRYLPQQSLIGPTLFPFYQLTILRGLPIVAAVDLLANVATIAFSATPGDLATRSAEVIFRLVSTLFVAWGIITLVFACVDYARNKPVVRARLEQWDPHKLPALKPQVPKEKSFNVRLFELGFHVLWMIYVLAIPTHYFLVLGPGARYIQSAGIALAPVWGKFYAILVGVLSVQLLGRILALRSSAQAWLRPLELAAKAIGAAGVCFLAFGQPLLIAINATMDPHKLADLNHVLVVAFRIVLVISVFGFFAELLKYLRGPEGLRRRPLTA